jgi:hypothetical protein
MNFFFLFQENSKKKKRKPKNINGNLALLFSNSTVFFLGLKFMFRDELILRIIQQLMQDNTMWQFS